MLQIKRLTAEGKKVLTRQLNEFQDRKRKKQVKFYIRLVDGTVHVPRFYNFQTPKISEIPPIPFLHAPLQFQGELMETPLRPQQTIFKKAMDELQTCFGTSIIMPCGSGKTNVAIAIALKLGVRTAVLCHRGLLLNQWTERLNDFVKGDFTIGRVQQQECTTADFMICSIPSLLSREYPAELLQFGLVIVDEAHHIAAPTFSKVLSRLQTQYTLGLTATPHRADGLEDMVYMFVGKPCFVMTVPDRPDVQVNIVTCDVSNTKEVWLKKSGDVAFSQMVTNLTIDSDRNHILLRIIQAMYAERPNSRGLLLSDRVAHLLTLHHLIESKHPGISEIISGTIHNPKKGEICFNRFLTLSTYQMFAEAIDFPGDFIILSTPKSRVEQSTGRVLRGRNPGVRPVIIDLFDPISIFYGMMRKRRDYYESCGYEIINVDM